MTSLAPAVFHMLSAPNVTLTLNVEPHIWTLSQRNCPTRCRILDQSELTKSNISLCALTHNVSLRHVRTCCLDQSEVCSPRREIYGPTSRQPALV